MDSPVPWQCQEPHSCSSPPVPLSPREVFLSFSLKTILKEELGAILFFSRAHGLSLQYELIPCISKVAPIWEGEGWR